MNRILSLTFLAVCLAYASGQVPCSSATAKMSHSTALSHINAASIKISSSGNCSDRNNPKCTSLDQANCKSIAGIVAYKKASKCDTIITGGTETGHATGTYSHWNGYKIDIRLNTCHDAYIKSNFKPAGLRPGDNAVLYKDGTTEYALEGSHWDITFK